jgi:hypothetical protein
MNLRIAGIALRQEVVAVPYRLDKASITDDYRDPSAP